VPEILVDELYRLVLGRLPDEEARREATARLAAGTLSRAGLLAELVASAEFVRVRALEDGIALARVARARGERPHVLTAPASADERAIEIPWVLSRYRGEPRVLDVGSANAERVYLEALVEAAPTVVGLDPAEAAVPGVRVEVGDLRRLPYGDRSLDVVLCVSTLEHVGADNAGYGVARGAGGIPEALAELRRVLSRDGYALVTVPCGAEQELGWFVQHGRAGWNRLFANADLFVVDQELYVLGEDGWHAGEDDRAAYGERGPAASAVLCSELHPGRRRHGTRRRVARMLGR
jgi:SAM-dependent methyltransferase